MSDREIVPISQPKTAAVTASRWKEWLCRIVFFLSFVAFILFAVRIFPFYTERYSSLKSRPSFMIGVDLLVDPHQLSRTGVYGVDAEGENDSEMLLYDLPDGQVLLMMDFFDLDDRIADGTPQTMRGVIQPIGDEIMPYLRSMLKTYEKASEKKAAEMAKALLFVDSRDAQLFRLTAPLVVSGCICFLSLICLFTRRREKVNSIA